MSEPCNIPAILSRAEGATPGPWTFEDCCIVADGEDIALLPQDRKGCTDDDTGEFIAHAREDVPALCEEVERLRAADVIDEGELAEAIERASRGLRQVGISPISGGAANVLARQVLGELPEVRKDFAAALSAPLPAALSEPEAGGK